MNLIKAGCLAAAVLAAGLTIANAQITVVGHYDDTTSSSSPATNAPSASLSHTNSTASTSTNSLPKGPQPDSTTYTNTVGMEFVKVPDGYWASRYETTQTAYQAIMGSNPSAFQGGNKPVDSVSYNDAVNFCQKLTAYEQAKGELTNGYYYTLPTETQWEAMVAGGGLDIAVTSQNSPRSGTAEVGSLGPNSWGLYDVRGNVMEFCLQDDPTKAYRVLRGGSWQDTIDVNLRIVFRYYAKPDDHGNTFGFRCILVQGAAGN